MPKKSSTGGPEQIVRDTFQIIDKNLRKASLAQLKAIRRGDRPTCSRFGGHFVGLPSEKWPEDSEQPYLPLLQICTQELPFKPKALQDIALLTVFVFHEEVCPTADERNGDGWILRTYKSLKGLVPLPCPNESFPLKTCRVDWKLSPNEAPCWEDLGNLDAAEFQSLPIEYTDKFHARYDNTNGTKVGGWPALVQSGLEADVDFIFQIGSEPKANWRWGDNGIAYFSRKKNGRWSCECQSY